MNLLEARIDDSGQQIVLSATSPTATAASAATAGATLPLPPHLAGRLQPQTPVTLGIRPESIRLAGEDEPGLAARAVLSEPLLAERQQLVRCTLGTAGTSRVSHAAPAEIVARVDGVERVPPGTPLRLSVDAGAAHVFAEDGSRL